MPTPLNGFPRQPLIHARKAYQNVNCGADGRCFAKVSAHECRDEIDVENADHAPVQSSDNHQHARQYIKFFHADFRSFLDSGLILCGHNLIVEKLRFTVKKVVLPVFAYLKMRGES